MSSSRDHSNLRSRVIRFTWSRGIELFARSRAPHVPIANRFPRCSRVRHRIALFRSGVARSRERYFFFLFFSAFFFSVSSVGTHSGRDTERQNGRKSKRRQERCTAVEEERERERSSLKKKKKMPMRPWWTRDRGATFWNYSKIACFGPTMLEWSKPRPPAVIGSRYFNTGPRTLEGHNPRAWLNSTLIRQTHTSWSERTVNWHRVNRTPVESYENIDWRCGVPRICLRFLCTCDKYTVRSRLFRIVS